jgi:hypothetical protein
MEMHLEIRCKAGPQQAALAEIFTLMSEGQGGAVIEEKFDAFGEPVARALATLLDAFHKYFFNVESFEIKKDKFVIDYVTGFEGGEFLPRLLEFLSLCGCTQLKGEAHGDGYTIVCRQKGQTFVCHEEDS